MAAFNFTRVKWILENVNIDLLDVSDCHSSFLEIDYSTWLEFIPRLTLSELARVLH